MTAAMIVADRVALTLFERYGKSALTCAWRTVGSEVGKLLGPHLPLRIPYPPDMR
jgi:hypothetical protein